MEEALKNFIEKKLKEETGQSISIQSTKMLGGGCINHASKAKTDQGNFFIKWNAQGPEDMFLREAECLEALADAQSELHIPKVYLKTAPKEDLPAVLVTEFLEPATGSTSQQDEVLGRGLAQIHQYQKDAFGFDHDNYCGATPQQNDWHSEWVAFFRDQRIGFLLNLIEKSRGISKDEKKVYDQLLDHLPKWIGHQPAASLNHGDLWSGNFMYTAQGPALIDPASYFADREFDLAMMGMFGGFSNRVWESYQEAYPLPSEWKERHDLYMLYHYLNHYYLFGGSYGQQALNIARKYA
ncbi:fructosamine kinase family protein [Catalinimonas niigatensis]|uniref:fructosamine kinase family protein n=1 Tax=Catalinimonas niigatensis TaxID=1397264 RepID=UPI0026658075|nr:fructosamine kinase family protein [Catalinimonas niigatensis]WPP50650.1 fructosamine kinase family protein [Catalinimonas niigatensis]